MIVPLISVITTYYAMKFGWVGKPLGVAVPWTTPPLISGYLATGKISGAVIQLVNLAIGGAIYYPFFKIADRQALQQEAEKRAQMANK